MVEMSDLDFRYGDRAIFSQLDLRIPKGKVTVVMGPSGCGKSTLLSLVSGRLQPEKGTVQFDGEDVPFGTGAPLYAMRRKMGMLFQNSALLTDLTVFENVAFPLREQTDLSPQLIRIMVLMKLELVGLRGARDMMPSSLSGGMVRRVALARAIVLDPAMVMYDEPFVGLDPISKAGIVKLIPELNDVLGLTSIVVTHNVREACDVGDYLYLLGNSRVINHGPPEQMMHSTQPDTRQFMQGLPDGPIAYRYPATDYLVDLGEFD